MVLNVFTGPCTKDDTLNQREATVFRRIGNLDVAGHHTARNRNESNVVFVPVITCSWHSDPTLDACKKDDKS
jgi:hypothetical protein